MHSRAVGLLLILMLLSACGSRTAPAPVMELSQPKSFRQFDNNKVYTVQRGDTLFSIAWYSGNDYRDLARFNNLSAPYRIYPGQQLHLTQIDKKSPEPIGQPTGQTSKINANQTVDRPKKQAYGESESAQKNSNQTFRAQVSRWLWPAAGKLVGRFSLGELGNKGIDIANVRGTPVLASAAGKVVYTGGALRGFGNLVIIKHTDAYLTAYAHNQDILVNEQDWIEAGQKIATMGDSGSSQVMLHFEVRYKGKSVDPLRFLPDR
ncbi:peptidoglycan DD-metalloendopeptidase family protein [Lacimicrobium alkaliphilum]|uniref:Membrane protein n=1 Tax=Lacimicrobium alkaliphilum TaxID=1526571 RepID=A0ABQ1QYI0_9ALTE|nr:peptidoglycan DD-metalloendopeptidase family protein [Lacimicrobium alkaliphilum]GGD49922.1 membrane protein [Lacimicrobium alkaliphilum]